MRNIPLLLKKKTSPKFSDCQAQTSKNGDYAVWNLLFVLSLCVGRSVIYFIHLNQAAPSILSHNVTLVGGRFLKIAHKKNIWQEQKYSWNTRNIPMHKRSAKVNMHKTAHFQNTRSTFKKVNKILKEKLENCRQLLTTFQHEVSFAWTRKWLPSSMQSNRNNNEINRI